MAKTKSARQAAALALVLAWPAFAGGTETRVEIESEGWQLVGDLATPEAESLRAFALLLHKAAGDRRAYGEMATALAAEGIASLRIDLRGHGESIGLGAFDPEVNRYMDQSDPAVVRNFELIRAGDRDIVSVMRWLKAQPELARLPLVIVGSSYTGEEMVEAAKLTRFADIYIALAPGSFSEESIAAVDPSGLPWLFVRAEVELAFFPELFAAIKDGSKSAEIWLLPGEGHATDLFDHNPNLLLRLIDWINGHLRPTVCNEETDSCDPAPCTSDADCDDGVFCNGVESCATDTGDCVAISSCPPSIPPTVCNEETDSCDPVP